MSEILPSGKLPHDLLEGLLERYTTADGSVLAGAGTGIDAALIRTGEPLLLAKTDPVTFVTEDLGHYIVHVNANDLAAMGGEPGWFLVTLLFPAGETTVQEVERRFGEIRRACDELSISFCGGHTEITDAVTRIVAAGVMLGVPMTDRTFQASRARPGDSIVMTKGAAVEATSIIARIRRQEVREAWGDEFVARCRGFINDPGISVLTEARIASSIDGVRAMHDPTEGGIATALHEMADAAGCGFIVDGGLIHIFPETRFLSERFAVDPMGLIASGALLIAVAPERGEELVETLEGNGVMAGVIGKMIGDPGKRSIVIDGNEFPLRRFDRDEILNI